MDCFVDDYRIDCPAGAERVVLEDSIMHRNRLVTAGSKMLGNFVSPIDATVVSRLDAAGIKILGRTRMGEFGIADLFTDARTVESGAVSAVAGGAAEFALCNDYTGSVRQQAVIRGLCYIHPTYGTISRYGLIPAVPSMDQIGILCKTPADGERLLPIIAGYDAKDGAMRSNSEFGIRNSEYGENQVSYSAGLRIGVPENVIERTSRKSMVQEFVKDFCDSVLDDPNSTLESFVNNSEFRIPKSEFSLNPEIRIDTAIFELKHYKVFTQVMRILCCAELSGNLSRYDGVKFGHRADSFSDLRELYTKSRTEGLGPDAKLAVIIGAMVLSRDYYTRYYDKAMRIRRLIKESLEFSKYDAIILPALSDSPDEALALHALPQLCGLPSVTVPFRGSGITLIADAKNENVLFSILRRFEI